MTPLKKWLSTLLQKELCIAGWAKTRNVTFWFMSRMIFKSSVSGICQCLLVQHYLLSWFERWHAQVWTAGTSECIAQVTLPQIENKSITSLHCQQVTMMGEKMCKKLTIKIYSHFRRQILPCLSFVFLHSPAPTPPQDHMCYTKHTSTNIWWEVMFKCFPKCR